jgi:peptidoglycan-associated lipoprotein
MRKYVVFALGLVLCLVFLAGCKKRPVPVTRAPEAAPAPRAVEPAVGPAPTIEMSAAPSTVERGQQTTLSWKSDHASSVLIDGGVGNVGPTGSVVVSPRESMTFTATARGTGGEARASTRVTVVAGETPIIASTDLDGLLKAIAEGRVRPVFFAYDRSELTEESRRILQENARWFRQFPGARVIVEGHCDERGTEEYNLALGDRRAVTTKDYLVQLGVDGGQLETISYGEERPFVQGHDESAWSQNRRAHFTVRR